jgi:hypothetical protein
MLEVLRLDGQPTETDWAYLDETPHDINDWSPPATVSDTFHRAGERCDECDFDKIVELLRNGCPAMLLMTLSDAFYMPDDDGMITPPVGSPSGEGRLVSVGRSAV